MTAHQMMVKVAAELARAGAVPCRDFFVAWVNRGWVSSEYYGLRLKEDGSFEVFYSDMGRQRILLATDDPEAARERFVDEVFMIAGLRGSGPRAVPQLPQRLWSEIVAERRRENP